MTKAADKVPAIAPAYPNASIDFNQVHKNDKAGKTGADIFKGALSVEAEPADEVDTAVAVDTTPTDAA